MNMKKGIVAALLVVAVAWVGWAQDDRGLLIASVGEDTPAERAGLIRGDVFIGIDGTEVASISELRNLLGDYRAGQTVSIAIERGGVAKNVPLELEDRLYRPALGIEFAGGLLPRGVDRLELDIGRSGVVIHVVVDGSPAEKAGLQPRDVIVSVNGDEVAAADFAEVIAGFEPGDTVTLAISRPGRNEAEEITARVVLGENEDGGSFLGVRYSPSFGFEFGRRLRGRLDDFERFEGFDRDLRERLDEGLRRIERREPFGDRADA